MNIAEVERVIERLVVREIQAKFARAFSRAERRTQRRNSWGCTIGNCIAPGVEFKAVLHDSVFGQGR